MMKKRPLLVVFACCITLVVASGCGSSSSSGTGTSQASGSTGTSASQTTGVSAQIQQELKKDLTRPTSIGITTKLNAKIPSQKTITYMECGVPSCAVLAIPLRHALTDVGWKLRVINTGSTPESIKAAWDSVVQNKPDGVITIANPSTIFQSELQALGQAHVPVIQITTTDKPGQGGTAATFADGPWYKLQGPRLARYVLVNGGTKAHAVLVEVPALPTVTIMQDSFKSYLTANCSTCKVDKLEVPLTSVGKDLSSRIVSYLSAHPDVKWVYTAFVDMNAGLPAALKEAGLNDVKVITFNTDPTTDQYIRQGQNVVAAVTYPGAEIKYRSVDWFLRHFANQSTAPSQNSPQPDWLVTKQNLPSSNTFTNVSSLDSQYRTLWGVK